MAWLVMGASWLFRFRVLQIGEALKVRSADKFRIGLSIATAVIFLREAATAKVLAGGTLILAREPLRISEPPPAPRSPKCGILP